MSTFLFAGQPASGHLNPLLAIARQMRADGHAVTFASFVPPRIRPLVSASGFPWIALPPSLSALGLAALPLLSGFAETFVAVRLFFAGACHYARSIGRVLDDLKPDAVVCDFAFPGAWLAAEARGIPYVIVYHVGLCFKGPGIPPFASGSPIGQPAGRKEKTCRFFSAILERRVDKAMARARRRLALPPGEGGFMAAPSSPWLTLVLTAEAIEAPRFELPPTTFFIGPCFATRQDARVSDFPFDQLSHGMPKVYVSLGTVFNRKPKVFSKIIKAFADGRCQVIISAGRALAALRSQHIPPHILLFEAVPQVDLLPRVDAVISHGGNNTVNETLAAGKPLLVLPVGGEQGDNASKVVYLGAGLRADIKRFTSHEIREKLDRLLAEPSFRQRAGEMAEALARTDGPVTACRFIVRLAQTRQPLQRPHGYPLTVNRDSPPPWEFA